MSRFAFINARLIDGTGSGPIEKSILLVEDSLIREVGPADKIDLPEGCEVIDAGGTTILPTLIDGHMHVAAEPGELDSMGHLRTNLQAVGILQRCLQWGTGVVAHAAGSPESIAVREVISSDMIKGCSDLLVGAAVTATCGHVRGRSADGPWEIRKAVREMIAAGADFIKTCASGGFQWEHEKLTHEDYTLEELEALTAQAHSREKRVHVHAHAQPGLHNAIESGCDVILHGALIDDKAIEEMAEKNLWYMPTLHITSEKAREGENWPPYMTERMKEAHPIHCAGVEKAKKIGINISTGTDGGPGSIMNELSLLVNCGFSPIESITAATKNTADCLGILDSTGTLEPDKRADFFIFRGDPLKDISTLSDIEKIIMVVKKGVIQKGSPSDLKVQ